MPTPTPLIDPAVASVRQYTTQYKQMVKDIIKPVPDFPKEGVMFWDINPLVADAGAMRIVISSMAQLVADLGYTHIASMESRGHYFAFPLAYALGLPVIPVRKAGKTPPPVISFEYGTEYSRDKIEVPANAPLGPDSRILLVDDVLATGGSARAGINLLLNFHPEQVDCLFLIEVKSLDGRKKLDDAKHVFTMVRL